MEVNDRFKGKRILVLGGGQAQIGLIRKAKTLGCYVVVVGIKGDYPGYELADSVHYVDIYDKTAVLDVALSEKVDGTCMVCSDYGLETLGYVCDQLSLPGISEKSAVLCADKAEMKSCLKMAGVPTALFTLVHDELEVKEACMELGFPLVLKAVDLQGSKGVYVCEDVESSLGAFNTAMSLSHKKCCLMERFLDGIEFGVQAYVHKGEVVFIQPHSDLIAKVGQSNIPVGHVMPMQHSSYGLDNDIGETVRKAIKALCLDNCAVNVDLILYDGCPYVIELTGRAGANSLPELTGYYLGLDYYSMILAGSLGFDPRESYDHRAADTFPMVMSQQLFTTYVGKVKEITYKGNVDVLEFAFFINHGDFVHGFSNSADCIGRVLCAGKEYDECEHKIEEFKKDINISIEV